MARTNRRREAGEIVNSKRSIKKSFRRGSRKNSKRKLQEIDPTNPDSWGDIEDEEYVVRGVN